LVDVDWTTWKAACTFDVHALRSWLVGKNVDRRERFPASREARAAGNGLTD